MRPGGTKARRPQSFPAKASLWPNPPGQEAQVPLVWPIPRGTEQTRREHRRSCRGKGPSAGSEGATRGASARPRGDAGRRGAGRGQRSPRLPRYRLQAGGFARRCPQEVTGKPTPCEGSPRPRATRRAEGQAWTGFRETQVSGKDPGVPPWITRRSREPRGPPGVCSPDLRPAVKPPPPTARPSRGGCNQAFTVSP